MCCKRRLPSKTPRGLVSKPFMCMANFPTNTEVSKFTGVFWLKWISPLEASLQKPCVIGGGCHGNTGRCYYGRHNCLKSIKTEAHDISYKVMYTPEALPLDSR
jgi:hypothetical protein